MVAPLGRRTQPLQTPKQTETKPVETPPQQQPPVGPNDGQQLVDLLKALGKQVETAWKAATKEPGGDPLVKFLAAFTGRDAAPVAQQQENQAKISQRQNETKDALGFTVSEPAPKKETPKAEAAAPKKTEGAGPKKTEGAAHKKTEGAGHKKTEGAGAKKTEGAAAKKTEGAETTTEPASPAEEQHPPIVATADFAETAARVAEAKVDGLASKAEAGALLYSISKELKLARAAGQTPEQITAKVQQLLGEFRIGVALAPDLIAVSEQIGAQLAFIGMTGDSPEAWEKLGLSLLGGKAPDAPKYVHVEKIMTIAEAMAAFEARGGNAQQPAGHPPVVGAPAVEIPAAETATPQAETRRPQSRRETRTDDGGQRTRLQEQKRLEEQRRREQAGDTGGGGGGGDHARLLQDQINVTTQNLENLRRMQEEQNLRDQLNRQQEEDQRRRR